MRRLLLVGKRLPRLESIEWSDCAKHPITDYQGLVLDCRTMGDFRPEQALIPILVPYLNLRHPTYLILPTLEPPAAAEVDIKLAPPPCSIRVRRALGRTVNLVRPNPPFTEYLTCLDGHQVIYEVLNLSPILVSPQITDNLQRMVCGQLSPWNMFILHPPTRSRENEAFKTIIEHFQPDYLEPDLPAPPEWARDVIANLPGISETQQEIAHLNQEIVSLQNIVARKTAEKEITENWAQMLWLDGIPLQNRVREAFDFLGFQTESPNPTGHMQDLIATHGSHKFYIEVTGSSGAIKLEKGRELIHWITDVPSPDQVTGVLVGNAFRNNKPDDRPPTANHKIFVTELERFAERRGFALVDVRELYRLITSKLNDEPVQLEMICAALTSHGVATFQDQPTINDKPSEPLNDKNELDPPTT
jgi:hypothetical protein